MVHSMDRLYVGPPTHGLEFEWVATWLAPAHVDSHECCRNKPVDRMDCDSYDGIKFAILAKRAQLVTIFAQSDLLRHARAMLNPRRARKPTAV